MAATTAAAAASVSPPGLNRLRLDAMTLVCTILLAFVAFVVLYPLALLVWNSFQVGTFGQATRFGLDNWQAALSQQRIVTALQNTVTLAVTRQAIAVVVGVLLAWLLARTNLPGRS